MSAFPIDEVNIVVHDELVNGLDTGENSCLEVTNFTHRGIERKDDASAVGKCCSSVEGWHCRCFLNCEIYFVGWFELGGVGGNNVELGDIFVLAGDEICNFL